jgi:hypothetical protein
MEVRVMTDGERAAQHAAQAEALIAEAENEGKGFGRAKGGIKEQTLVVHASAHASLAVYYAGLGRA